MCQFGERILRALTVAVTLFVATAGCTSNSAKKHYLLAEKLWTDGNYSSAVLEFDKVTIKDPKGKLGLQALFRSATTQALFLSEYNEAIRKLQIYADSPVADPVLAWDAEKQIGEILFVKTEQYDRAIQHYQGLIQKRPAAAEIAEFSFQIAKGNFYLWHFSDAVRLYRELVRKFPGTTWAEKAMYEIGVAYYTQGEQKDKKGDAYQEAIGAFRAFIKTYPQSRWIAEAKFGIASCLEELDQLDAAYKAYEELSTTYPSPNVITIKLTRIRERQAQRSR